MRSLFIDDGHTSRSNRAVMIQNNFKIVGTANCNYRGQNKFVAVYATGFQMNQTAKAKVAETCSHSGRRLTAKERIYMIE